MSEQDYLELAISLAFNSVPMGGGPFAAVVVMPTGGEFFAGINAVTMRHDPTAHAEVTAIRAACESLKTHDLSGAVLYASCAPCPMCLGAAMWAGIREIVYAASPKDAAAAGFDDAEFYRQMGKARQLFFISEDPQSEAPMVMHEDRRKNRLMPFDAWTAHAGRIDY